MTEPEKKPEEKKEIKDEAPPPLGVAVSETLKTTDAVK